MRTTTRPVSVFAILAFLLGNISIGCGGKDESSLTTAVPRRLMSQSAPEAPEPPYVAKSGAAAETARSEPPRAEIPEIERIATLPAREAKIGEKIELQVEVGSQTAWENELQIEWYLNGVQLDDEDRLVLDTDSLSPGDIVMVKAKTNAPGRDSRWASSAPVRIAPPPPPSILSQPSVEMVDGEYRYRLMAKSMLESAVLNFTLSEGPKGMRVDEKTGLVTWSPGDGQFGQFQIDITVMDQWGSGAAQRFTIAVAKGDQPPPASAR